jgi:pyridoxine 5-phosphate synthase
MAPRLSVNLNKVALLRNSRHTGVPDLLKYAALVREAGADGITVHPRPDERHIRRDDVLKLSEWMAPWRPRFELNIEGFPDDRLLQIVEIARPEQCTLVPDDPTAFTSEEGWKLDNHDSRLVASAVPAFARLGCRVILFIDPDPLVIARIVPTGAAGVEIYTGSYAGEFRAQGPGKYFRDTVAAAQAAQAAGMRINLGHDLNLENLPPLIAAIPAVAEASIGHELTADALVVGFPNAVRAYKAALAGTPGDTPDAQDRSV